ncbi:hypothetical protein [Streptomyces sp. AC550_RSS872]|uniref:hypothetical protein n=1 Tax=Streptomyces sp. AC550_RSS872 TaxID=2823689 RepID=UPI001C257682
MSTDECPGGLEHFLLGAIVDSGLITGSGTKVSSSGASWRRVRERSRSSVAAAQLRPRCFSKRSAGRSVSFTG